MKRNEVKQKKKTDSLLARIKEAQENKDWGEVSDILDEATVDDKDEIDELKSIIPDLILHSKWLIRASTVGFIGDFQLRKFVNLVKACLKDRNSVVRSYALMAYYDLRRAKALPVIEEFCEAKDVGLRVTALILLFIETGDEIAFNKLSRILIRKRCHPMHHYASVNIFDYYCDVRRRSEVISLFENILIQIPKSQGVAKDIRSMLNKWKKTK